MPVPGARAERDARPPGRPAEAPFLGVGVGLRPPHYGDILARAVERRLAIDWVEAVSENYMIAGGRPLRVLAEVRAALPLVLHGVSLNLGSTDPLDEGYLDDLARLVDRFEPAWVSDHLCWTGVGGHNLHDLLPLPYSEEAVHHLAGRIRRVQERLGRRIAVENVSSYVEFTSSVLREWEFLSAVASEADCGILLDVNNVLVSAHNMGFDARRYVDAIDPARVFQIHLAGPSEQGPLLIDTHDHPVREEAWDLYARVIERTGPVSTLVEWDANLPSFDELCREATRARRLLAQRFPEHDARPGPHAATDLAPAHRA